MAAFLTAIKRIVDFAEGIHGLKFNERGQEQPRMDLVDHRGSLNVVGFINPGPGADRVGKLFFVARPELKNGDANEARFSELDLVQAITKVIAAEGHDRARCRDVLLQLLLKAGEFGVSVESLGHICPRLFDRRERVESVEIKYVGRTCDGLQSKPVS